MKKLTSILLVFALVFSMSAATLAAGADVGADSSGGVTTVSLVLDGTQISATVPLTVTLAVTSAGVVTGPSGYTIKNTSVMPVKVESVAITPQEGFAVAGTATATPIGAITLTDGRDGSPAAISDWTADKTSTAWNMGAKDSETDEITLTFGGTVSGIVQDITSAKAAFTVTFTISAGVNAGA